MVFLLIILGIILLLCLWGCLYFAWRLYISSHSTRGTAVVHDVIKEYRTYRPGGWSYKAYVRVMLDGKQIEKKLSFWVNKGPITFEQGDYHVPVIINIGERGKVRIMVEDKNALLIFLTFALGVMALIFGTVMSLVVIYNFK